MIDKKQARLYAAGLRKRLDAATVEEYGRKAAGLLAGLREFKDAETVYLYCPVRNEVPTEYISNEAQKKGKITAYPVVCGSTMSFYGADGKENMKKGYMNIPEPEAAENMLVDNDSGIIIIPGLAFDIYGNRAGYGKGFYDRYLAEHKNLVRAGIAYSFQVFDEFETDVWDEPLDYIITEQKIIKCMKRGIL